MLDDVELSGIMCNYVELCGIGQNTSIQLLIIEYYNTDNNKLNFVNKLQIIIPCNAMQCMYN